MKNKKTVDEKFKGIKFVISSGKGGVGKTGFGTQFVAPFLYEKTGEKVQYITIDDVNNSAETLQDTSILDIVKLKEKESGKLIDYLASDKSCVFDIGGNKTAYNVVREIGDSELLNNIWWVLPVADGDEDAMIAEKTYDEICKADHDPKILVVLTKAIDMEDDGYKDQFINVFGHEVIDVEYCLKKYIDISQHLVMPILSIYNISKAMGKTIYELSDDENIQKHRDDRAALSAKKDEIFAEKGGDSKEYKEMEKLWKKANRFLPLLKKFQRYRVNYIDTMFEKMTKIMSK